MKAILEIESEMGRIRTQKNAPRIIDIDILFYNKEIINTKNLTIPHPLMQERNFVMFPLNELSPNFIHPVFKKNIHRLLRSCKDKLAVNKIWNDFMSLNLFCTRNEIQFCNHWGEYWSRQNYTC